MAKVTYKMFGLEEHLKQIRKLGQAADVAKMEAALAGAEVIQDAANPKAPGPNIGIEVDAPSLARGITAVNIGPLKEFWYYRFFEFGTSPHEISPEAAQALRGFEGGQEIFSEGHQVGGIAAQPFLRPAMDTSGNAVLMRMAWVYNRKLAEAVR